MSKLERNAGKEGISDLTVIAFVTSFLVPLVGWIAGFKARKQIEESEGKFTGRPFATAAIWIGGILTIGWIAMIALMGLSGMHNGGDDDFNRGGFRHMGNYQNFDNNQGAPDANGFPGGPGMMFQPDPNQTPNP